MISLGFQFEQGLVSATSLRAIFITAGLKCQAGLILGRCDLCGNGGEVVLFPVPDPVNLGGNLHVCEVCLKLCGEAWEAHKKRYNLES
jgi:hypothetical protein